MPKEHVRKRGKRKPKAEGEDEYNHRPTDFDYVPPTEASASTSTSEPVGAGGIHPSRLAMMKNGRPAPPPPAATTDSGAAGAGGDGGEEEGQANWTRGSRVESDIPFGMLDPDLKAYFRDVEERIKDWEGVSSAGEEREDRQIFLQSVLTELRGSELQVATDPDTAVVLERLLPSLGDWGRRVIGDAVGDNWEALLRHRFGSHVAQTWFTLAADTLDREERGVWPPQQTASKKEKDVGQLPTMTDLFASLLTTLLPVLPQLLTHAHASPPIRILLLILIPNRTLPSLSGSEGAGVVRSKRSGKYRRNQGVQGKSILGDDDEAKGKVKGKGKGKEEVAGERRVPERLVEMRRKVREELLQNVQAVEWRSMGVNQVGCAAVQLLLDVEVEDGTAEESGSLLDHVTEGLVSYLNSGSTKLPPSQPFLASLLIQATGTHLFEAILTSAPSPVFTAVWETYISSKIGRLASHPFANFVVAKGVSRLDDEAVGKVVEECQSVSGGKGIIKTGRTAVLNAIVERLAQLGASGNGVIDLLRSALEIASKEDASIVPCLMALKTLPSYNALLNGEEDRDDDVPTDGVDADAEAQAQATARRSAWENRRNAKPRGDPLQPNMQGCLLLQALVELKGANEVVAESLLAQPVDTLLTYAKSPIASHLLDKTITSTVLPPKYRKKVFTAFMGRYRELAEDRLGSRVADTIWAAADGFMREKIARSLIPEATALGNSQFGQYFARKLDLHLLQRRPEEWREQQIGVRHHFAHQKDGKTGVAAGVAGAESEGKRKREEKGEEQKDEIDTLFESAEKKGKGKKARAV